MAGELAAEWIKIPDGNGNLQKVWIRDSTARRDIAQLQSDIGSLVIPTKTSDLTNDSDFQTGTQVSSAISAEAGLMIPYGYCTTAAATVAKTVTVSPAVTSLETGLAIAVKFQYANTSTSPTLNVNNLGAVAIKRYGTTAAGTSAASNWNANSVVMLIYDGTYWMLTDFNNTTYSGMTDAEYQAGTGTSNRLITPARLKAAILYHAPVTSVNGSTGAVTVNVPTKTSDLTNDSGFITASAVPNPSSAVPVMDGTAAAGSSDDYARADHVHPSDTTKQDALTTAQLAAVDSGINASIVGNFTPTQVGTTYTSNAYVSSASFGRISVYRVAPNLCIMYASFALSAAYTGTTTTIGKINGFTETVMVLQNVAGGAGNEMAVYITGGQIRLLNGAGASGEWFRFVIPLVGTFT